MLGLQITGRTCEELFKYGLKQSGTFPIDPDGDDYGYPAIDVYCDFESKCLSVSKARAYVDHMLNASISIYLFIADRQTVVGSPKFSRFEGNDNISMRMSYDDIPIRQIEELIRLSQECSQEFQWDCYFAPIEIRGDKLLTWTDRSGNLKCFSNFFNAIHASIIIYCI